MLHKPREPLEAAKILADTFIVEQGEFTVKNSVCEFKLNHRGQIQPLIKIRCLMIGL